ncbi:MAG: dual specificity protein phosphatase family protein [Leptolyngbyaceae cyanobacterium]
MAEGTLIDSIWWIVPGQLAGMRKPVADELADLKAQGIGAIVSVMDDPSNLDLYEAAGIPYRWLPVKGGTAPTQEQAEMFRAFADEQIAAGHAIAVHCSSGRRRTGTLLGAYLVLTGTPYEEVIAAIAQANPAVEMRAAQLDFLSTLTSERSLS